VVPRVGDAVALDGRVRADLGLAVRALAVGDVGVAAGGVERPPVERAHDVAVPDGAAVAEVGAEVRAERIHDMRITLRVTPTDEVTAPVVQRPRRRRELVGIPDAEPAERDGEGKAVFSHQSLNTLVAFSWRNFGHT